MIKLKRKDIAVVPIYDPDELIKPARFNRKEQAEIAKVDEFFGNKSQMQQSMIHVPEQAKERCDQGIVKYIGSEVTDVKIGDYVIYSGYTGTLVNLENEGTLIIFPWRFILATLPDPPITSVSGVYFRDSTNGEYYEATYEILMSLLAQSFRDADWHHGFHVKTVKPSQEELLKRDYE